MKNSCLPVCAIAFSVGLLACSDSGSPTQSDVSIRFSDAPVDSAVSVTITVDTLTFRSEDNEDIVVDQFTSNELGLLNDDTFTIDLLQVQGEKNRLVLDSVMLPVGEYSDLRIGVKDEDVNMSYVEETIGIRKPIKVPSGELKLGAFTVSPTSRQSFVIEFGLRQSMTYNPGPDRYILKPRGVRIVRLDEAVTISGKFSEGLLTTAQDCGEVDTVAGLEMVYLYAGTGHAGGTLGDVFDPDVARGVPEGTIAPVAATVIGETDENGERTFVLSYVEPGDYTIALRCGVNNDDPDQYKGLTIPDPAGELDEFTVSAGDRVECNFPLGSTSCSIN